MAVAFCLLFPGFATACKYSVRDVGFVALDQKYYELRLITSGEMSEEELSQMEQQLSSLLRDTNILVTIAGVESGETTQKEREQFQKSKQTVAFLVDRFSMKESEQTFRELFLQPINLADQQAVSEMVWSLSRSTLRDKILEASLKAHSVLLVVEGTGEEANQSAWQLGKQVSADVKETLPDLPKLIEQPTVILNVSTEERQEERVLLWSMGCRIDDETTTYVLPLFGRGRLLGEPLLVPGTSATELVTILGYVGQDCECELDRSWMQGKMFPHRWDEGIQEQAAKTLGFDPGNPLVMTEITRILARGPGVRRNLQVGQVTETDLIELDHENAENVSKETADDILRELNLLPESAGNETALEETDSGQSTEASVETATATTQNELVEADSVSIPIGNDIQVHDFYISRSILVAFEVGTGLLILGLVWFLLRRRRR